MQFVYLSKKSKSICSASPTQRKTRKIHIWKFWGFWWRLNGLRPTSWTNTWPWLCHLNVQTRADETFTSSVSDCRWRFVSRLSVLAPKVLVFPQLAPSARTPEIRKNWFTWCVLIVISRKALWFWGNLATNMITSLELIEYRSSHRLANIHQTLGSGQIGLQSARRIGRIKVSCAMKVLGANANDLHSGLFPCCRF